MKKVRLPARIRRVVVLATLAGAAISAVVVSGGTNVWEAWVAGDKHDSATPNTEAKGEPAIVSRVIDGDTISVQLLNTQGTARVRLIGIDTPELGHGTGPNECFAEDARSILETLLPVGAEVALSTDPSQLQEDKYGRLLRHVTDQATGTNVTLALLEAGAGLEYTYNQPYTGQSEYRAAETAARNHALGYWGACL